MKHIISPAAYLFVIAAFATALLVVVHAITYEPIQRQLQEAQERNMRLVLPTAEEFVQREDFTPVGNMQAVFDARSGGRDVGVVISLNPSGYSGNIDMIVGICTEQNNISGMRIVRHTETPGFGDAAVRTPFYSQFDNRPLNPLTVVSRNATGDQIDSIAASTITTVAIVSGVNDAIEWYRGGGR